MNMPTSLPTDLLRQIDDIRGLHPVSMWPLAMGWWALIAMAVVLIGMIITIYMRRRRWKHSWRHDALQTLSDLEANLNDGNAQAIAATLAGALRRTAMRKFSRADCAGLQGDAWLQWLKSHDPQEFDWSRHGKILNQIPYAPPGIPLSSRQVRELIGATKKWVA